MRGGGDQTEEWMGREATPARSAVSVRVACVILAISSLLPLTALFLVDADDPGDDALISLTFAKNLARGDGFVFNHSPPVLGTTSPAFTLGVAAVAALSTASATNVALWISVMCWLGLVWSFFLLRTQLGLAAGQAAAIGAVLAATGWVEHLSMEAYPFALLLVVTTAAALGRRPFLAGVCGGLLFLTRGEGVLYAAIVGGALALAEVKRGRQAGRSPTLDFVSGAALPIAAWAAYAWSTFGSVLPNTLAAKIAQVASGLWAPFPVRLLEVWLPGWGLGPVAGRAATVAGYALAATGLVVMIKRLRALLLFPIWATAYAAGYWWLDVPGYPWYWLPIELVLAVLAGLGLEAAAGALGRNPGWLQWRRVAAAGLAASIVAGSALGTVRTLSHNGTGDRHHAYRALAAWLAANADPADEVAYTEIGYLGYYTDLGVVDLVGLVTPDVVADVAGGDFVSGFWRHQPRYLVHLEGSRFTGSIVEDPMFSAFYLPVATFAGAAGRSLTVFEARLRTAGGAGVSPPAS